jgi:hypothetical protein
MFRGMPLVVGEYTSLSAFPLRVKEHDALCSGLMDTRVDCDMQIMTVGLVSGGFINGFDNSLIVL